MLYKAIFYYLDVFSLDKIMLMICTPLDEPCYNSHHSETYICVQSKSLTFQLSKKLRNVKCTNSIIKWICIFLLFENLLRLPNL